MKLLSWLYDFSWNLWVIHEWILFLNEIWLHMKVFFSIDFDLMVVFLFFYLCFFNLCFFNLFFWFLCFLYTCFFVFFVYLCFFAFFVFFILILVIVYYLCFLGDPYLHNVKNLGQNKLFSNFFLPISFFIAQSARNFTFYNVLKKI